MSNDKQPRKYRLLKDLPDAKAGTILTYDGTDQYNYISTGLVPSWYNKDYIDNPANSHWFELIPDEPVNKPLPENKFSCCWYNHLKEVGIVFNNEVPKNKRPQIEAAITEALNDTVVDKKSVKPPLGLLPKHIWEEQRIWDIEEAILRYRAAFKEIPQEWIDEKYELSKSLKPTPTNKEQQEVSKEWKILAWINKDTNAPEIEFGTMERFLSHPEKYSIGKVKRLSDNEVFSCGETVLWDGEKVLINGFEISEGNHSVHSAMMFYNKKGNNYNLLYAKKPSPQSVSTDNTDVACLSISDIKETWPTFYDANKLILQELATKKIKQQ